MIVVQGSAKMKWELVNTLSVNKNCLSASGKSCETGEWFDFNSYKSLGGRQIDSVEYNSGSVVLNDGTTLYFRNYNIGYLLIFVDVNGYTKGPNILGRDLFGLTTLS